jgi:hypothetical protein
MPAWKSVDQILVRTVRNQSFNWKNCAFLNAYFSSAGGETGTIVTSEILLDSNQSGLTPSGTRFVPLVVTNRALLGPFSEVQLTSISILDLDERLLKKSIFRKSFFAPLIACFVNTNGSELRFSIPVSVPLNCCPRVNRSCSRNQDEPHADGRRSIEIGSNTSRSSSSCSVSELSEGSLRSGVTRKTFPLRTSGT